LSNITHWRAINTLSRQHYIEPLASASIAQVHTAITHQGDEVVVKIVRPDIEKIIKRDIVQQIRILKIFSQLCGIFRLSQHIQHV
jgi:ubiquinone biosynthesis protein